MSQRDYGYFGKGMTGYAHYMQAFDRNFGSGGGGNGGGGGGGHGCLIAVIALLLILCVMFPDW
ncbi:MAG: HFLK protein [Oscillospiraceae bacterium]|nr:HFLK protein [Oscillospiraceae bacterium]